MSRIDCPNPQTVVVVAGGEPVSRDVLAGLGEPALVVAADSGLDIADAIGLRVDVLVGDLDSVHPELLAAAEQGATEVIRHPAAKDHTDLDLALQLALEHPHDRLVVVGGGGGWVSHFLANAAVIASIPSAVEWRLNRTVIQVASPTRNVNVDGAIGDLVSLVPLGGPCHGVVTTGLEWVLDDATLEALSSRGVSNVLTHPTASVRLDTGTLLVIHELR